MAVQGPIESEIAVTLHVESLCDEFEQHLRGGGSPDLSVWLTRAADLPSHALSKLASIEMEYRWAAGDRPSVEEYLARVPQLGQDPVSLYSLVETEYRCRSVREPGVSAVSYRKRFPALACHPIWQEGPWAVELTLRADEIDPGQSGNENDNSDGVSNLIQEIARSLAPAQGPGELGRLDGFAILGVIGQGGMGFVLKARDAKLGREVAIKAMKPENAALPEARRRFLDEAKAMAALQHDRIVQIYEIGESNNPPYFVMPLLRGESLASRLAKNKPMTLREVLRLGREIAEGLSAAHARELIHRDIKPANIWLEAPGEKAVDNLPHVRLLDFGLVRPQFRVPTSDPQQQLTPRGYVVGTPDYMAPEQACGRRIDGRADLFSLGVVLYEACTGRRPFKDPDWVAEVIPDPPLAHEFNPTAAPLSGLIVKLLDRDPTERPKSADAVVKDLRDLEILLETPTVIRPNGGEKKSRPKYLYYAVAAAMLLVILLALGGWIANRSGHDQSDGDSGGPIGGATGGGDGVVHKPFKGWVDVRVYSNQPGRHDKGLADARILPLRKGDKYKILAEVKPKGYLYILSIDTEGIVEPIYPWQPGDWGTRPAQEQRVESLSLPPQIDGGYELEVPESGMRTFIMLVRQTPLDVSDDELQGLLGKLPPQRPLPERDAAIWFEDGQEVTDEKERKTRGHKVVTINSPVLTLQRLLKEKLQSHADYTRAVGFATVTE